MIKPAHVAEIHKEMCIRAGCNIAHDFTDPCASCSVSGWGQYHSQCSNVGRATLISKSPIHQAAWPAVFLPLKLLARPEDKGLGDIIARTIGPLGGDAFKSWHLKTFGKSCGCNARQEAWNARFPLNG